MPETLRACRPGDPFIQPNWRQLRAQEVVTVPGRRTDDDLVNAFCDYLERGHAGRYQAAIEAAQELTQPRHRERRMEVQAWLLAGSSIRDVTERCSLSEEIIAMYVAIFFDVLGRLKARDWITIQVLMVEDRDLSAVGRLQNLWRYVGFFGGPLALEALLAVSRGQRIPAAFLSESGIAGDEEEDRLRSQIELFVATKLAVTPEEWNNVEKLHEELRARYPEYVCEIPDSVWVLLCGAAGKRRRHAKAAESQESKPAAVEPRSRRKTAALIAAMMQGPTCR